MLQQKNNNMQTQFENAKIATAHAQAKAKDFTEKKAEAQAKVQVLQKTVQEKEQDINCNKITITNKDFEITKLTKSRDDQQIAV